MKRWLRALVRACLVLLALEVTARLAFDRIDPRAFGDLEGSSTWWRLRWVDGMTHPTRGNAVPSHLTYDPSRGWVTKPNLRQVRVGQHGTADTNSRGLRGLREYPYARRPGSRRVLVIGDSFAFGENVDDDQIFESLMEKARPGLEMINVGVSGYDHEQMLAALHEGLRYHPDVVLLPFINGDATRNMLSFRTYAKPYLKPAAGGCVLAGVPVPPPEAVLRAYYLRPRLLDLLALLRDRFAPVRDVCTDGALDRLARAAEVGGARFVAVYPDIHPNLDPPIDLFTDFCRRDRICCGVFRPRKASPRLEEADEKADKAYDHWRPERHRELAGFLLKFLDSGARCDPPRLILNSRR